ncbi:MAG: protein kinase domain-containing protein, partial [Myxococcota bacterium]
RQYAVKKILPQYTRDQELVQMFIEEARIASCLSFPNIVQVFDLCTSAEDEYFIVMEFVDGQDLAEVLHAAAQAGRHIPQAMAVQIVRDVLLALDYAHNAPGPDGKPLRLIHRDISPHNVIVGFNGQIKLTDFGIAKVQQSGHKTMAGIVKGKFGYMSPEQARGKPLDHRSDLYNVGILLYEILVGERLFAGASDLSTLDRMRAATVPPVPPTLRVSAELDGLMRKVLAVDPSQRPEDAAQLELAFADIAHRENLVCRRAEIATLMQELLRGTPVPRAPVRHTQKLTLRSALDVAAPVSASRGAIDLDRPSTRAARPSSLSSKPVEAPVPPGGSANRSTVRRVDATPAEGRVRSLPAPPTGDSAHSRQQLGSSTPVISGGKGARILDAEPTALSTAPRSAPPQRETPAYSEETRIEVAPTAPPPVIRTAADPGPVAGVGQGASRAIDLGALEARGSSAAVPLPQPTLDRRPGPSTLERTASPSNIQDLRPSPPPPVPTSARALPLPPPPTAAATSARVRPLPPSTEGGPAGEVPAVQQVDAAPRREHGPSRPQPRMEIDPSAVTGMIEGIFPDLPGPAVEGPSPTRIFMADALA